MSSRGRSEPEFHHFRRERGSRYLESTLVHARVFAAALELKCDCQLFDCLSINRKFPKIVAKVVGLKPHYGQRLSGMDDVICAAGIAGPARKDARWKAERFIAVEAVTCD